MPKNKIRYKKIKNMADKGHCYEGVRKSIISLNENSHLIFFYIRLFCMTSDILRALRYFTEAIHWVTMMGQ